MLKHNKIALIDSGINRLHPELKNTTCSGLNLINNNKTDDISDKIGHGTSIAVQIIRFAPKAHIYMLKIFGDTLEADLELFRKALSFCVRRNIRVVNISLGMISSDSEKLLAKICQDALEKNIFLVAANSNSNIRSYPANLDKVFGVRHVDNLKSGDIIYDVENSIQFGANGAYHDQINKKTSISNSYAAPVISAFIFQFINNYNNELSINKLNKLLKQQHIKQIKYYKLPKIYSYRKVFDCLSFIDQYKNKKMIINAKQKKKLIMKNNLLKDYQIQTPILFVIGDKGFSVAKIIRQCFEELGYKIELIDHKNIEYFLNYKFDNLVKTNYERKNSMRCLIDISLKKLDFNFVDLIIFVYNVKFWNFLAPKTNFQIINIISKIIKSDINVFVINSYSLAYYEKKVINKIKNQININDNTFLLYLTFKRKDIIDLNSLGTKIYYGMNSINNMVDEIIKKFT